MAAGVDSVNEADTSNGGMTHIMKTYSIQEVWQIFVKNIIVIACSTVILGGLAFVYAKHQQTVTYTSERLLAVQHHVNYHYRADSQVNANTAMAPTYAEIIKSPVITDSAQKSLPKHLRKQISRSEFADAVTAKQKDGTVVISVKATADSAAKSAAIANHTAETAAEKLPLINHDADQIMLFPAAKKSTAEMTRHGSVKKDALAGAALGFILGMTFGFIRTSWKDVA